MRQASLRSLASYSRLSSRSGKTRDFFGIADITSKDVAGAFSSQFKLPAKKIEQKYDSLVRARNRLANEEVDEDATFGRVRFDANNVAKSHGQYDPDQTNKMYDTVEITQKFLPIDENGNQQSTEQEDCTESSEQQQQQTNIGNAAFRISEISPAKSMADVLSLFRCKDATEFASKYTNKPPLTFYFEASVEDEMGNQKESPKATRSSLSEVKPELNSSAESESKSNTDSVGDVEGRLKRHQLLDEKGNAVLDERTDLEQFEEEQTTGFIDEAGAKFDFDASYDQEVDVKEQPKKEPAISHLKKVRAQKVTPVSETLKQRLERTERPYSFLPHLKLDSHGFKNYEHQVPDWRSFRHVDILNHIRGSIVYNNYDILAINKPYGIASHDEERSREPIDMNKLVGELAKSMRIEKVFLAHRLDKNTTGILLFATSKERADMLSKLFRTNEIKKTYWCITNGIPNPEHAIIDIPIGEFTVAGKVRSCPAPVGLDEPMQIAKKYREAKRAVTEYKVLNASKNVALVEVKPESGVKHQIRCHLGFCLNTPILGDHKYCHFGKVAPQKLPLPVLKSLQLRQTKVRTLPMHLHAKSIVIPRAKANGETLFIDAPIPPHFAANLKSLKLEMKDR